MLYNADKACVKVGNKMTKSFQANQGVKQGCILSPLLFNIYLSDLQRKVETAENLPALISQNTPLGCLIWADDLLLISQTEAGLNGMPKVLKVYAEENGLTVNMKKTKVMIFNRGNKLIENNFHTSSATLENIKTFKYLGFIISAKNCSFMPTVEDLSIKATRVVYALNSKIKLSKLPTN